jgi:glyoxylase-like metal-dependent hydrolase (beta-lactamase superfamily II)
MGNKFVEGLAAITTTKQEIKPDILVLQFTIVTACMVGDPNSPKGEWVLVDTGLENSASFILKTAAERFGKNSRPQAIILTHGHFDHVGSVIKLSTEWDVPVYIHELELPYITGQKDYPVGDASVGGGTVAQMAPTFPHTAINISYRAVALPADGGVPGMPGWQWIHTPGHTEGHVSLFRPGDGVLIAGDAFSTVKQESLASVVSQSERISGPPAYLTVNWEEAEKSVKLLHDLQPSLVIPSHGQPMQGEELRTRLEMLVKNFDEIAKPSQGRFVDRP